MNIRITHIDGSLPNLALMALSAFHRAKGDDIYFTRDVERGLFEGEYGAVYGSCIFERSNERAELAELALSASRVDALNLRQTLRRHAIHMSYDSPGDVPEPCGLWCELCSEHVEDDRITGHKSDCLLSEPPILARMEKAS